MGKMTVSHTIHHEKLYPPDDYLSEEYRNVSLWNRPYWYYAPPAILTSVLCFMLLPWYVAAVLTVELVLVAWLNDYMHCAIHIKGHRLERYDWFLKMRDLHFGHHLDEKVNIGIFSSLMDRMLGTLEPTQLAPIYVKERRAGSPVQRR